jgi:hypothetical protein
MGRLNDNLTEIFNLDEKPIESNVVSVEYKESTLPIIKEDSTEQKDKDFEQVRINMYELLNQGTELLEDAIHIARESEQPKSFEVAATIMKQLTEMNSQILSLHQRRQSIEDSVSRRKDIAQPTNVPSPTVTNNTMFVGTTADLNNIIEQMGMKNVTKN